ncbi:MAG: putative prophage phiRv2 integrase [Actinomycetia bacterium]|nr:putative prophage phiRv2 integrase [Actinomycetes bacterium]
MSIRTRKLKTGGRAYDVLMRRPDGSQFARSFRTRRDAETWQAQQKADMSRRCWHDPTAGAVEFGEYAEEWLRNRVNLRPKTVAVYRSQLRCHIVPAFGGRSLISITKRDVRSWHADLSRRKTPMVAAKSYRLLATIMNTAVDDDLLPGTPCRLRGAGGEGSAERPLLSIDEAYALADAIEPRFRAFILLAAFCGLRLGELLGLTRADVDLLHRKLSVTKQRQEVDGGIQITLPKTAAGVRSVGIPAAIVGDLEAHLATWAEPGLHGVFFAGPLGGVRRAAFYTAWAAAKEATGLREGIRPHDLRHLANTLAAQVPGTTSKDLMVRMGHRSSQAALRYLHASETADQAISAGIDAAIRRNQQQEGGTEYRLG